MLRTWRERRRRGDRGVALVEFALVLPLLALVVFGVIDMARAYRTQAHLRNASREGAAFGRQTPALVDSGTSTPCTGGDIASTAKREESNESNTFSVSVKNASGTTLTGCTTSPSTPSPGQEIVVKVSASFKVLTPLVSVFTGSPITLSSTTRAVVAGG